MTHDPQETTPSDEEASLAVLLVSYVYLLTASLVFASALSLGWAVVAVPFLGFPSLGPWQMWGLLTLDNQLKGRKRSKSGVWTIAELGEGVREAWLHAGGTWLTVGLLWMMFG